VLLGTWLAKRRGMRWLCLVLVALTACNHADDGACAMDRGLYCTTPGAVCMDDERTECRCNGGSWFCSSCGDPSACTPGDSCDYWGFEVDCSCSCDSNGAWRCSTNDPRHPCPYGTGGPHDAGFDGIP
jgi:hypothetical protein